jgi:hypothetical protein
MIVSRKALETSQELNPASIIITSYSRASFAIRTVSPFVAIDLSILGTADFGVLQLKKQQQQWLEIKAIFHNQNLNIKLQI